MGGNRETGNGADTAGPRDKLSSINIIRDLKAAFNLDFTAVPNKHPFLLKSV